MPHALTDPIMICSMKIQPALGIAFASIFLSSCSTRMNTRQNISATRTVTHFGEIWYTAHEEPFVIFLPKGYAEDAPRDYYAGDWVSSPENGARWFIPFDGVGKFDREFLLEQALSMRTVGDIRRQNRKGREIAAAKVLWGSILTPLYFGAAMGGYPGPYPSLFEN